jgi:hypothetical protein
VVVVNAAVSTTGSNAKAKVVVLGGGGRQLSRGLVPVLDKLTVFPGESGRPWRLEVCSCSVLLLDALSGLLGFLHNILTLCGVHRGRLLNAKPRKK